MAGLTTDGIFDTFSQPAFSDVDMSLRLIPDLSGALRRHNIYEPPAGFVVRRRRLDVPRRAK
jgi:hypothetical protein